LAGAIYALIALAFVLVYKSSRMVNFAVGEWVMSGALLAGAGYYALGLGAGAALIFAAGGMAALGVAFNALVVRRVTTGPVISAIMVTLGLGALMRGASALIFGGIPAGVALPIPIEPLLIGAVPVSPEKLLAAVASAAGIAAAAMVYGRSRTSVALRAIADDRQAALAAGINIDRHFALVWAVTGVVSVFAGILWTMAAGGGFGLALVGLKVFPIVVIGDIDCLAGTLVAAMLVGLIESLAAGFVDPQLGTGSAASPPICS